MILWKWWNLAFVKGYGVPWMSFLICLGRCLSDYSLSSLKSVLPLWSICWGSWLVGTILTVLRYGVCCLHLRRSISSLHISIRWRQQAVGVLVASSLQMCTLCMRIYLSGSNQLVCSMMVWSAGMFVSWHPKEFVCGLSKSSEVIDDECVLWALYR